ncbi:MAG: DNA alkylation repair protein [Candidatus Magasanikbacteria bacterium CG_4_10_14_0_2_um_filter_37_12]|uniref:DNA alkylation repair protein n=1 Tax=Candidatus Magasanikbacteria bacterium CG_4_10_14_0_2_um_filter_37_12 TaxID=1974637 RepID=A0A2M7VA61_9BACT|nr:MAG: DNA alkylation repair protein [Candidatus Magasanikbacteria bacterium CG_4_10_14_0_2_um_filter_37_12]
MKQEILKLIDQELQKNRDLVYKAGATNFFKEKINPIGVRTPIVRKIAKKYFPHNQNRKDIFLLCERLLAKKTFEETIIAFDWVYRIKNDLVITDFARLEKWIKKYVDNWAFCDDFCTHPFGYLVFKYPELVPKVKKWTKSKNRWFRRASAVIFIYAIKKKKFLRHVFEVADILLFDPDVLVQKGYGWSLKVASNVYPTKVFQFVMNRNKKMPRTALRYAIEKYPLEMKKVAMGK